MAERLADAIRRVAFQRSIGARPCAHAAEIGEVGPRLTTCPSCEAHGIQWVKLRMCLTCGNVGCCDSSAEHHARDHFEATGHPVMRPIEPGAAWAWCYRDEAHLGTAPIPGLGASDSVSDAPRCDFGE